MQSVNISKRKFENLKQLELPKEVMSTEASFYKLQHMGKIKVFKSLYRTNGVVFGNKLSTLQSLDDNREILPDSFVIPDALVSVDKDIKGFVLPYIKGINLEAYLANPNIKPTEKIKYLKQIGEMLDKLAHMRKETNLDCYINDLHASNFIIEDKTKQLRVVDLDSCRICGLKPSPARYLTPISLLTNVRNIKNSKKYDIYRKEILDDDGSIILNVTDNYDVEYCKYKNYRDELGFVNSNENSDLYCYIIVFLNYLYGGNVNLLSLEQFYNYMNYLEKIGINQKLITAIERIVLNAPNKNIGPYLDTLTDEQVYRANQKVYKAI